MVNLTQHGARKGCSCFYCRHQGGRSVTQDRRRENRRFRRATRQALRCFVEPPRTFKSECRA